MELELKREQMDNYDLVLDTEVCQEETVEVIVPDACGDIERIVDAGGQICLSGKDVHEGGVSISGVVKGWVLYRPEGDEGLCRVEVKLPFTMHADGAGVHEQGMCVAVPCLRAIDARALNPRKVLVRADVGAAFQAFQPRQMILCQSIEAPEEAGVQQLTCQQMAYTTAAVQEREFTFYDEIRLSSGPGGQVQLLCVWAQAHCSESKVIGSKLIFKGEVTVHVHYQVDGELCAMRCPLAFSQIMETGVVGDDADCTVDMCVTSVDHSQGGEDGRTLNVTLELLGQAVVREQRLVQLLQDTYSTTCDMLTEQEGFPVYRRLECGVRPQSVRELLETESTVKSVIDAWVSICEQKQERQDEQLQLSAQLRVNVLYLDEQDEPRSLSRPLSVSGRLDLPQGGICQYRCQCPGEVFATPAAGGVEVRFNPELRCLITLCGTVPVITNAKLGQSHDAQSETRPSVVLRPAAPEERLWDIAKAYATTCERILQANALEGEKLPAGQMLLIPGTR